MLLWKTTDISPVTPFVQKLYETEGNFGHANYVKIKHQHTFTEQATWETDSWKRCGLTDSFCFTGDDLRSQVTNTQVMRSILTKMGSTYPVSKRDVGSGPLKPAGYFEKENFRSELRQICQDATEGKLWCGTLCGEISINLNYAVFQWPALLVKSIPWALYPMQSEKWLSFWIEQLWTG